MWCERVGTCDDKIWQDMTSDNAMNFFEVWICKCTFYCFVSFHFSSFRKFATSPQGEKMKCVTMGVVLGCFGKVFQERSPCPPSFVIHCSIHAPAGRKFYPWRQCPLCPRKQWFFSGSSACLLSGWTLRTNTCKGHVGWVLTPDLNSSLHHQHTLELKNHLGSKEK